MSVPFKQLTDFFVELGAAEVGHTDKSYLAHAIGVHNDLRDWQCDEELCRAGLFHSIYGTQKFQKFTLSQDRRHEIRKLIGERAERLAWFNCVMDRNHFDQEVRKTGDCYTIVNRETGEEFAVPPEEFDDLVRMHLCDWLEQVPRSGEWDYRYDAYRAMADRLGGIALECWQRVFANHSKQPVSS